MSFERPPPPLFRDRRHAGVRLAAALAQELDRRSDLVVLALPRGGVPVGAEVARALGAPLDVFVVRKLGYPGREELAMGAIASGGVRVINRDVVDELDVPPRVIAEASTREANEIARREAAYRGGRAPLDVRGRTVLLVDDGLATGSTMRAAVAALRELGPARIVVAAPVGSVPACGSLAEVADALVCLATPSPFRAVGLWYEDFEQTSDDEVRRLLEEPREELSSRPDRAQARGQRPGVPR